MAESNTPGSRRRLPSSARLLVAQVGYQLRLLLRTPRALGAGVAVPALLLVLSNPKGGGVPAAHLAGLAVLGVTVTAWVTHGIGLVAAREAGVLRRWRAAPLPSWCYFAGRITATVLVATFERRGLHVLHAATEPEAVRRCREFEPDGGVVKLTQEIRYCRQGIVGNRHRGPDPGGGRRSRCCRPSRPPRRCTARPRAISIVVSG